jgi:nicotinate-nucleotide--dimethylbenzimidazole phosphoribosyltransferase
MSTWPRVDSADIAAAITAPDAQARAEATERQKILTKPAGSLGVLEDLSVWLSGVQGQCPPRALDNVRVVIVAGDHGVARTAATSAYPPEVTAQMVLNFLAGGAAVNVLARSNNATVRVVDIAVDVPVDFYREAIGDQADELTRFRIRRSSGSIDCEDALTQDEALDAFSAGVAIANEEIDAGADLLIVGDMGIGNTTPAAALVALIARVDPSTVVGRGTGIDDATWMRKCTAVREAMRRGRPVVSDSMALLATVGGADLACITGILMQSAARRVPVLLDGVITCACALVAHRMVYGAHEWWAASHRSTEPAASTALEIMALSPILSLNLRLGEGTGALSALPLLRSAGDTLREMATFDEAGVSDR